MIGTDLVETFVLPRFGQFTLALDVRDFAKDDLDERREQAVRHTEHGAAEAKSTYAMPQIVGEHHVASKGDAEWMIEVQHLEQALASDLMQIAVRQRANVGCRLPHVITILAPEVIAEHIVRT